MSGAGGAVGRGGFTLVELLVALVIAGIIGVALAGMFQGQSRFFSQHRALREARTVSRAGANVLVNELRMVEASAGVEAATSTSITLRVPYAFGLVCASTAAATTMMLMPVDSVTVADAATAGVAWRASSGDYTYAADDDPLGTGLEATCTAQGLDPVDDGRVVTVMPALASGATTGTPIFIYQRVRYRFKSEAGEYGLYRQVIGSDADEELLVAPFDSAATRFAFYVDGQTAAQDSVPADLATMTGILLKLEGAATVRTAGESSTTTVPMSTAVFFKNRQ